MRQATTKLDALASARRLADAAAEAVEGAVEAGARLTGGGKLIDEHQVHAERIAQLATEVRAARELAAYAQRQAQAGKGDTPRGGEALRFRAGGLRAIGTRALGARGAHATELDDAVAALTRDSARSFAKTEIAPIAQEMHRQDHLVPEGLIQ